MKYQDEVKAFITKAERSLRAGKLLLSEGDYDFAISRLYYSMFYCAVASLLIKDMKFSKHSAVISYFRHGHISTLHIWWARRPLASSRATNYAALIPATDDIDEWNKTRQFIIDFSKWENSLNKHLIERARKDILEANGGKPPKVLDPFSGGHQRSGLLHSGDRFGD